MCPERKDVTKIFHPTAKIPEPPTRCLLLLLALALQKRAELGARTPGRCSQLTVVITAVYAKQSLVLLRVVFHSKLDTKDTARRAGGTMRSVLHHIIHGIIMHFDYVIPGTSTDYDKNQTP